MINPKEAAAHLDNLRISHEITRQLQARRARPTVTLFLANHGWAGSFRNVPDMPDVTVPLPWTARAPAHTVAADIAKRFPAAEITVRL